MNKVIKYDPATGVKYYGDIALPTQMEIIEDTTIYDTVGEVIRNFPETFDLEIGGKYLMNFGFLIAYAGIPNNIYGRSEVGVVENTVNIWLNVHFATIEGLETVCFLQGSKVITAQNIGGVGKIPLHFWILNGYTNWQIYDYTHYNSYIEFIKI